MQHTDLCLGLTAAAVATLAVAAAHDLRSRLVPNRLPLCTLAIGTAIRGLDHELSGAAGMAGVLFALALAAWGFGALGGADVKLVVAASFLFPPVAVPGFCLMVAMAGGALSLACLALRLLPARIRGPRAASPTPAPAPPGLPYAVAILGGAVLQLAAGR